MSGIDLLNIQPHQVSRDLRGYSVFFYGEPKSGKTTIATKFPRHLLLAFEKGYNAIPGAMAQPINAWAEFRKVLKQLSNAEVQQMYETIIIDTADIAYDLCEKYICANAKRSDGGFGVDAIGDIPFGKGYTMVAKEFDECLRSIVQMGYGLVLISHAVDKTFTDETGAEFNQIIPTLGNAIDKQMEEDGTEYFTDERTNLYTNVTQELDFDELVGTFNSIVNTLIENNDKEKFEGYWQPRIVQITDKYLGKGQKVNQCSREQTEALDLIVTDLKELVASEVNE